MGWGMNNHTLYLALDTLCSGTSIASFELASFTVAVSTPSVLVMPLEAVQKGHCSDLAQYLCDEQEIRVIRVHLALGHPQWGSEKWVILSNAALGHPQG